MDTPKHHRKFAEQCEQMAGEKPTLAASFQTLAQAWREVATEIEQFEKKGNGFTRTEV